ncbi:MAG: hypothetical protein ACTHLW_05950 [Verrucomicrobiota bacterium]
MSAWSPVIVNTNVPPRGSGTQPATTIKAKSMLGSFAWGSSPGKATLTYVGSAPVTQGADIRINIARHYFCGICKSDVASRSTGGGMLRTLEFWDYRYYLTWDWTFCAFNKPDVRLSAGTRLKRYRHLYPADYNAWRWTYTDEPLKAWEILAAILNFRTLGLSGGVAEGTIGTPWSWDLTDRGLFPDGVLNMPIYDFDCQGGRRLDGALSELAQRSGTVFTLISSVAHPYNLIWTVKGYGTLPNFAKIDGEKIGTSLSENPTNIRILGGRNLYQVMDIDLVPDWSAAWEQFLVFERFAMDIYNRGTDPTTGVAFASTPNDPDQYVGRQLATARALEITVAEYVALTGNAAFADYRKFAGRSRMDMPAALYLQMLVFRAFRPNFTYIVNAAGKNVPIESMDIADQLLCRVSHNPANGAMTFWPGEPVEGNGYAIAKAYQVGSDLFKTVKPEQMSLDFFKSTSRAWSAASFQIDDSGEGVRFVVFDQPMIVSNNLLIDVNGHKVLNAAFTLTVPSVKAALTFEVEPFSSWRGTYPTVSRDHVENVPTLHGEYVLQNGGQTEIVYGNGKTAGQNAIEIADSLLLRQYSYIDGGVENVWDGKSDLTTFGTELSSLIDRVQIEVGPEVGVKEQIDFTNERDRDNFEPERELDRKAVQNTLYPGQNQLRQQAETARKIASGFRQMPFAARLMSRMLSGSLGSEQPLQLCWIKNAPAGTLAAGTPIRKAPSATVVGAISTNTIGLHPTAVTSAATVFVGVTVRQGEDAQKPFQVQNTGGGLARVMGPVNENDTLGLLQTPGSDNTYLVKDGTPSVGKALQKITSSSVQLIQVQFGAGGGGAAGVELFRLKTMYSDVMLCTRVSDSIDYYVAKPYKLRNSIASETIEAVNYTYAYDVSYTERTQSGGGITEAQVVIPYFLPINGTYPGDEIRATPIPSTSMIKIPGTPNTMVNVTWLDLNLDGRAWCDTRAL